MPENLTGKVAVVTGGSKGIGKGIVEGLCEAGMTVYFTGRSTSQAIPPEPMTLQATEVSAAALGGKPIPVQVDHNNDAEVEALFKRVADEQGRLDVLVNNVYQIPNPPAMGKGFWEHPVSVWDDQCGVGLRGYYVASVFAAPLMPIRAPRSSAAGIASTRRVASSAPESAVARIAAPARVHGIDRSICPSRMTIMAPVARTPRKLAICSCWVK